MWYTEHIMVMAIAEPESRPRYPELGRYVHAARRRAGMTQEELAVRLGVTQSHLGRVERGVRRPRVDTLPRWARGLGVPLTELQRAYGLDREDTAPADRDTARDRVWRSLSPRVQEALLKMADSLADLLTPGMLEQTPDEEPDGEGDGEVD